MHESRHRWVRELETRALQVSTTVSEDTPPDYSNFGLGFCKQWQDFFILLWALSLLTALRLFCYKNKGLKEPTRIRFPSARFKNFVNDLNVTKSFFLGVGLGRSCLEQRQTCRGTEG